MGLFDILAPVLGGAGGFLVGGPAGAVAGASAGHGLASGMSQEAEAKRREKLNMELGALDTAYSPFVSNKSTKVAQTDPGMGGIGAALAGGLSGYQTGMNLTNAYKDAATKKSLVQVNPTQADNGWTELIKRRNMQPNQSAANFGQVSQELVT